VVNALQLQSMISGRPVASTAHKLPAALRGFAPRPAEQQYLFSAA